MLYNHLNQMKMCKCWCTFFFKSVTYILKYVDAIVKLCDCSIKRTGHLSVWLWIGCISSRSIIQTYFQRIDRKLNCFSCTKWHLDNTSVLFYFPYNFSRLVCVCMPLASNPIYRLFVVVFLYSVQISILYLHKYFFMKFCKHE